MVVTRLLFQAVRKFGRFYNNNHPVLTSLSSLGLSATMSGINSARSGCFTSNFSRSVQTTEATDNKRHSYEAEVDFPNLRVITIPALGDNFMYLVVDKSTRKAFAVDPVEPETILEAVDREDATLTSILTTHHHWDHAGGNNKLLELHKRKHSTDEALKVYGGDDRIDGLTNKVGNGDEIAVGSVKISCLFTPCHTSGHICYHIDTNDHKTQKPFVFTGDTLFIGGCGRFFEGTADQMHHALQTLGALHPDTLVFCGHEYTVANLKFVLSVDPNNKQAQEKLAAAERMRAAKLGTVPSLIHEENSYNVFMRCKDPTIQAAVGATSPVDCMDKLRTSKNNF